MASKKFLSIVIPFHNEYESLFELIPRLDIVLGEIKSEVEVYLVDDGSTDKSYDFVNNFKPKHFDKKIIRNDKKSGQTVCYSKAFEAASGTYILRMDADLQDSPEDLPLFFEHFQNGAQLIMGLREVRKHRRIIRMASMIYDLLITMLFNSPLHSNSGSFVAFKAEFVKNIPWVKNDHRYIPLIAMHRGALNIREVIVQHSNRKFGQSKYDPVKKLIKGIPEVIFFLIRLKRGYYNLV